MSFPIDRVNYRTFGAEWRGEVFVCDIDRTYLATRFSSLRGLAKIPFETALEKKDIDGMAVLLKEIRRGPEVQSRHTPLYFISASPAQLRPVIERKMLLDGLEYDGTTFKDWVGVVRQLRLKRFREQLGYKITALLQARLELPAGAEHVLLGDDIENDALAYAVYADIVAGRLRGEVLATLLRRQGVSDEDARAIEELCARLEPGGGVRRIYLRTERHEPEALIDFAPHVVAARSALQIGLCLMAAGSISQRGLLRVAGDLVARGLTREQVTALVDDAIRRCLVPLDLVAELELALKQRHLLGQGGLSRDVDPLWKEACCRRPDAPWTPGSFFD